MTEKFEVEVFDEKGELSINISYVLAFYEKKIKEIELAQKEYKEKIQQAMEERGIKKFENEFITITYIEPTTRVSLDSKKLKQEEPDLYIKYANESEVKASVRIKVK
jgi:predicted phage-related endonuclease